MSIEPGTRIGPYQVTAAIGAGGMGEVYRARDTKLGRDVALKVLPEAFTADVDRLSRFQREAKVLASLNHPHIGHIYGLEEADGQRALVLELVEGPTLADRIAQGPLPLDEALPIAKQIAEALEAAHEQGIVHRDLKPANVKVKPDGTVKVLDFGLARMAAGEPGTESADDSQSPTLTRDTALGSILGTAAYMSPEQARGKAVDKRSDIWSFGVCLFEMLSGKRPFNGETTTDVLAAIVGQEPDWQLLEAATPWRVRELIEQCLQKDVRARLRDIGDAGIAVDRTLAAPEDAPRPPTSTPRSGRRWMILAPALLAALGGWLLRPLLSPSPPASEQPTTRFAITLPAGGSPPALSADARHVAFTDPEGLKVRAMDSLEVRLIPATGGAVGPPFFSPDGQWIGYLSSCCSLHRVRVEGGAPIPVLHTDVISGASWGHEDTIVFGLRARGLARVAVDGGGFTALTQPRREEGELGHTWPHVLPHGKTVLFTVETDSQPGVGVASLETGQHRVLFAGSKPHYVSSGHVVFIEAGTLFAVPFSLDELEASGDPFPILQGVSTHGWSTGTVDLFSVSEGGSLVYVPGSGEPVARRTGLVEVDRTGRALRLVESGSDYVYPRLSSNETVIAVSEQRETRDLWFLDLQRAGPTRFTFAGSVYLSEWTPEGGALVYLSTHPPEGLYRQKTDGSEAETILSEGFQHPGAWSPSGEVLAVTRVEPETREDIWIVPRDGSEARPFAETAFAELAPVFSPDGHHLAYVSDESGMREVYLRPFPGPGGKKAVSKGGGTEPLWSAESSEIFYRRGNELRSVSVRQLAPTIELGEDRLLFEGAFDKTRVGPPNYDVSADGQRFYMVRAEESSRTGVQSIHVVLNWFDEVVGVAE